MAHRDRQIDGRQRGAHMRRHVIIAFGCVNEQFVAVRDESVEKSFEVAANIRVGIFLNDERGRGMADMKSNQAGLKLLFRDPRGNLVREFIKSTASRGEL